MADTNKNLTPRKRLNITEISAAIALSGQLADILGQSPQRNPQDVTLKYQDFDYTASEITTALSQFAFANGLLEDTLSPVAKDLRAFTSHLEGVLRDSQRPPEKQAGSIPDYITIPDVADPTASPKKIQVEPYLKQLRSQIKDIEKHNLDTRLAEARQNIFASKSIIQRQIASVLSHQIPSEAVENIFKVDEDKFSAALEYAASVSGSQEEMISQTIDSFAQASLGGKFIANRLDTGTSQAVVAQAVNQFRDTGLYNQLTGSFGAIKELRALSDKLSGEHFIVGFYQNIIQSQPHLSHAEAVSQALKAYQALNLLSQTNQPLFLNPAKQHESFILSLKQSGVSGQSIQNIAFGNNAAPLNIGELLISSYNHNLSADYAKHKVAKQFSTPGGNDFNSRSMNLALQGGLSIFGLDGLLKDKKGDGAKAADQINSIIDKHHSRESDELLAFLLKKPGGLSPLERARGFALLKNRLGSFHDQARLILLIEKLSPGTIPGELVSGARFISSPFRQAGAWIAQKTSQVGIAFGKWFAQSTSKVVSWVAVNAPKAVAALGSGIAKVFAALAATFGWEILVTAAICIVVIGLVIIMSKVTQFPLETAHIYPLPKEVAQVAFDLDKAVCSPDKAPVTLPKPSGGIALRAWEITSDLYQGFWCFWNRSPIHQPTDTVDYPPSYPELFWWDLYLKNPNPPVSMVSVSEQSMFWCTQLTYQAYKKTGDLANWKSVSFMSDGQLNDFRDRGKYIEAKDVTPTNAIPGSVVFFHVENDDGREANHVGILNNVGTGYIGVTQSNAGSKQETINFKSGGGLADLPGIKVVGIGNP